MKRYIFLVFFSLFFLEAKNSEIETIYSRLDPKCLSKLFAFYHLHSETEQGKKALNDAFALINKHRTSSIELSAIPLFKRIDLDSFLSILTKQPEEKLPKLLSEEIAFVDKISSHLKHLKLFGHNGIDKIMDNKEAWGQ